MLHAFFAKLPSHLMRLVGFEMGTESHPVAMGLTGHPTDILPASILVYQE
ncbi:MAG: hypothetical protein JW861_06965 [Bacteroidales bacterium]|nr:hypothetical protein [Bacteroidales bacterium]